ncbi:MAG: imidazole glycerol phosphate synthase subunit HisH [Deltaproteobacteria bacterium]
MKSREVVIVDYGMGNLFSIERAIVEANGEPLVSDDPHKILSAERLILPGVGSFPKAREELERRNLIEPIYAFIHSGRPLLGICLGMQLLFSESEEFGISKGLNVIPGRVVRFRAPVDDDERFKIPHIGWNHLKRCEKSWDRTILHGLPGEERGTLVYFLHSYFVIPDDVSAVLAMTSYGLGPFYSVVSKYNVVGCQFHPEKSGEMGLRIYKNFLTA